ncbi:MAG TPA: hypothetical protein DEP05_00220 [Betaproteobacteria bacterium]|nr:hypothetical protein [Betaproteobacteria bacterium]
MPKTVIGGTVYRVDQSVKQAATVEKIEFPMVAADQSVPVGAQGTLYLQDTPPVIGHYDKGDDLNYQDSNRHNDSTLHVDSNIGPTKYTVAKTA